MLGVDKISRTVAIIILVVSILLFVVSLFVGIKYNSLRLFFLFLGIVSLLGVAYAIYALKYCETHTCKMNTKEKFSDSAKLIVYTASWCGHCQQLKPTLTQLSDDFPGQVAILQCDGGDKQECDSSNIQGFPTIRNSSGEEHSGPRTYDALKEFASL